MTVDVTDTGTSGPPEDLVTARTLWWAAAAFAAIGNALIFLAGDTKQILALQPEALTGPDAEAIAAGMNTAAKVGGVVFALGLAALCALFVHLMLRRKRWARIVLDVGGFLLVWNAVGVVIGVLVPSDRPAVPGFPDGSALAFLVVAALALAGLCGGVAVWRQHTADADEYLGARRGRG